MKKTVLIILVILAVFILGMSYIVGFDPSLIDVQSGSYKSWLTFALIIAMCSTILFLAYELYQKAKIYQVGENPDDENALSKDNLYKGINALVRFGLLVLIAILLIGVFCVAVIPHFGDENAQAFNGNFALFAILGLVIGLLFFALSVKNWWNRMDPKRVIERISEEKIVAELERKTGKKYGKLSWFEKVLQVAPTYTDEDVTIGHNYDGIEELDNPPPPWFMFLFYGTILFAVVYFGIYIVGNGPTQEEEYIAEVEAAEIAIAEYKANNKGLVDETNVELLTDAAFISEGQKIYMKNCAVCHKDKGEGGIGPNLTDKYWIHGGDIKSVFSTVKFGVPAKGMIAWKDLGGENIQKVSSYILSLQGSNPEGAKEPEGILEGGEPGDAGSGSDTTNVENEPTD